jgi:hypothetical protein
MARNAVEAAALFATLERVARQTVEEFPRQTAVLWFGMQRARTERISLDAALRQFKRGKDDFGLLDAGDRLLGLLRQIDKTFPELKAEAMVRVGAILHPTG